MVFGFVMIACIDIVNVKKKVIINILQFQNFECSFRIQNNHSGGRPGEQPTAPNHHSPGVMGSDHPGQPGHQGQSRHHGQPVHRENSGPPAAQQGCKTDHDRIPGVNHPGLQGQPGANQPGVIKSGCPGQSTGEQRSVGQPGAPGRSLRNCVKHIRTRCCASNCHQRGKSSSGHPGSSFDVCSDAALRVDTDILHCTSTSTEKVFVVPGPGQPGSQYGNLCSIEIKMCCSSSCYRFSKNKKTS